MEQSSGLRRGLLESGGAAWNPLQGVKQGSGLRRGLPESSDLSAGARLGHLMEQNGLQRVEQGSGHYRDLPESLDLSVGAQLGHLMEWNGSLSHRSRRSSDVSEAANESTVVRYLRH